MTLEKLGKLLMGEPGYRVKQAAQAIFKQGVPSFDLIATLPAALRERLKDVPILSFTSEKIRSSKDRTAHKAAVVLADGKRIETVLMSPKPGLWTTCISSQVGCALRCSFCATGLMGFTRNLTAEEITDQVLFWIQYMNRPDIKQFTESAHLSNVVYMGMGEPMLNFDNVATSLRWLSDPEQFGIGQRHLSVSTAGIAPGIDRFSNLFPQVNLALSLHSAIPEIRTRLVPINKAYPLARLTRSLKSYFGQHKRKIFIEYTLLSDQNDRPNDARALIQFIEALGAKHLLHVNLIVWNPTDTPNKPSTPDAAKKFSETLKDAGISTTFRKNLGQDIDAACGQLVLQTEKKNSLPPLRGKARMGGRHEARD